MFLLNAFKTIICKKRKNVAHHQVFLKRAEVGPFVFLFSSFQYTVDSKQMFII